MAEQWRRQRGHDERFCSECGELVKQTAAVCVHCGAALSWSVRGKVAGASESSGSGLARAMCYLLTWITGLIFLVIAKNDPEVRFHARQSIVFGVASVVAWVAVSIFTGIIDFMPLIGGLLSGLAWATFSIGWLAVWVLLMVKAYRGERFRLLSLV